MEENYVYPIKVEREEKFFNISLLDFPEVMTRCKRCSTRGTGFISINNY